MAEVLVTYDTTVSRTGSPEYRVQACGKPISDNLWEGWLEFIPADGSKSLRTRRETTQPNREDLEYWATGLEIVYLEGALERALAPERPAVHPVPARSAVFEGPAPHPDHVHAAPGAPLDPFRVHASQGDETLKKQLEALEEWQVRNVAIAHSIESEHDAERKQKSELVESILTTVRS